MSFFTNSHPTVSFSLICAVIMFCTTLTLGILFVPKVRTFSLIIYINLSLLTVASEMFCLKMKSGNQMSGVLKNVKSFVRRCLGLTARSSLFLAD